MAFTRSTAPAVIPSLFSVEGADEFSSAGIPGAYQFSWDAVPWIESPLSLRGAETNPLPNIDTMDPEQRNALLNSGYDPLMAMMRYQPQYSSLDIAKYRYDPFGGYMQYQDTGGNTGYLMSPGKTLAPDLDLRTNYENAGLPMFSNMATPNQDQWWNLGYDPYGVAASQKSLYKLAEPVGQGWFSQNMDWLVPAVIGGLGGYAALTGTGVSGAAGATAPGAVDDALGAFLMEAGELPAASAYGQAVLAGTPNWAIPGVSGAGGALGYTGALGTAVNDPLGAWLIEQGYPMDPQYAAEVTAGTPNWASQPTLWDQAKDLWQKKPPMPSMPGGGAQPTGGDGGDGMSLWSDVVNPYAYAPPSTGTPRYQAHEATPYGFEDELQRRLALIRGAQ